MPTYDYECQACGHRMEVFQSITENALRKCPECRRLKLRRLIGAGSGLIFKGSGFYITDYRSDSYQKGQKGEAAGKEPGTGDGAAKSEPSKGKGETPKSGKGSSGKGSSGKVSSGKGSSGKGSSRKGTGGK
ncbi:MAG: zinc ribbon domain-containing protein [Gemmatimonadetes bacterium]|nr:zinc ribbon domain-containing protein [Gemmatimonadota bacterium]